MSDYLHDWTTLTLFGQRACQTWNDVAAWERFFNTYPARSFLELGTWTGGFALWLLLTQGFYRPYALWRRMERPDWPQLGAFLRLGIPAGLAVLVEVSSFTFMALFISRMGTTAAAGHQIASNMAAVLYMVPLALGIATSARTSYWLGAGQPGLARRAT